MNARYPTANTTMCAERCVTSFLSVQDESPVLVDSRHRNTITRVIRWAVVALGMAMLPPCLHAQDVKDTAGPAIEHSRDHSYTNCVGLKMVQLSSGTFEMGSPAREEERGGGENQVSVVLSAPFLISATEVTQQQWHKVMASTPWKGKDTAFKEGDDLPAAFVSYGDALDFCEELTSMEKEAGTLPPGSHYTLPTEAQWEYACRAGRQSAYGFKGDHSALGDYAWWKGRDSLETAFHTVATKKPNAWGLYDMHGNVQEWCLDQYVNQLPGGTDPEGKAKEKPVMQVARGGGYRSWYSQCRTAARSPYEDYRYADIGFRVVCVGFRVPPPDKDPAE